MSALAIEVTGLVKRYGDRLAVAGLDLRLEAGRTLALLGPNGAGKTTTIETCEGLRAADSGHVRVLGLDPKVDGAALRPRLGVMLQEQGVYPQVLPRELLAVYAAMFADPLDVDDLLERVGLIESLDTRFRDMSGGQKQRLSLALALVGRPEIAFLDEPTAGLDPAARHRAWELVRDLQADGVSVVLTTHLLDEAEELADDVVIIDHGRVVASGTPSELARSEEVVSLTTDADVDLADLAGLVGCQVTAAGRHRYTLATTATPALIARLATALADADVVMTSLTTGHQSLEAVYLQMTTSEPVPARDHTTQETPTAVSEGLGRSRRSRRAGDS